MEKITTEEDMDKLDMFQFIFGKIDVFVWWDLEIISAVEYCYKIRDSVRKI